MGDRDHTFECLEKASAGRSGRLEYIKGEDFLEPLPSDPRYIDLLRCVLQKGDVGGAHCGKPIRSG
jgi:hypothetical protein